MRVADDECVHGMTLAKQGCSESQQVSVAFGAHQSSGESEPFPTAKIWELPLERVLPGGGRSPASRKLRCIHAARNYANVALIAPGGQPQQMLPHTF